MFSRVLSEINPWTDDGMFNAVRGQGFRPGGYSDNDNTLTAVARALITRRLKDGEDFNIKIIPLGEAYDLDNVVLRATHGDVESIDNIENMLIISQVDDEASIENAFGSVERSISTHNGWKRHQKAEAFLNKEMRARVLICEENKSAIVVTDRMTVPHWHLIGSMLPAYVPALFVDIPLDDNEKAVLKSLALHGSNSFISEISKLEDNYDIRGKRIQSMIGGFELRERENQVAMVDNEISRLRNQMNDLMERYATVCERIDLANVRRAGLKYMCDNTPDDDHLVKFFQRNKCLDVVEVNGSRISFIVRTYYDNFNPDEYERFRENDSWFDEIITRSGDFNNKENCRKVMDAMFMTGQLRMRMCALYHLDIRGSVSTTAGYSFPPNCADYIANYHLDHHRCFGNYERVIIENLSNGDTVAAINSCIASAKSVNIAESGATFNPMMHQVFSSQKKCFELPDGMCVTPSGALKWLNEQEGDAQ